MKKLGLVAGLSVTALMTGCASIMTDDDTSVRLLTSNGEDAVVMMDGIKYDAPTVLNVKKSKDDKIIKTVPGSSCQGEVVLESEMNPWVLGNIIWSPVSFLSTTTDAATDKMWRYDEEAVIQCK